MKILMTGSDGYIGSHLKPYLESRGHEIDEYRGDILDFIIEDTNLPDMVIHLAALTGVRKSIEMPDQYYKVNVIGTREVFIGCREYDIPVVFASSSNALEVTNPYAETKAINETDMPENSVGFRPHTVYPGRQDMLFEKLKRGDVKYINGGHHRDFTHIDDLCSAVFTIVENYGILRGKVVNIGTGQTVSVLKVAKAMGYDGEVIFESTPTERAVTCADITELTELGWNPMKDIFEEIHALCNSK